MLSIPRLRLGRDAVLINLMSDSLQCKSQNSQNKISSRLDGFFMFIGYEEDHFKILERYQTSLTMLLEDLHAIHT